MKGLAVETAGWLILAIVAIIILAIVFSKLVPVVGQWMDAAVAGLKRTLCGLLGWAGFMFGC